MSRFKIDDRTRALILKHLAETNLRISDLFTEKGKAEYPLLLQRAFASHDEEWLAEQLATSGSLRQERFCSEAEIRAKARALAIEVFEEFVLVASLERLLEEGVISLPVHRRDEIKFDPAEDDLSHFLKNFSPPQPYRIWVVRWCKALVAAQGKGGNAHPLRIEKPASVEDVERMESQIGQNLPISLRKMFLEFSAGIEFGWVLPRESSPPLGIYSGGFEGIKLAWLKGLEDERQGWIRHVFSKPTDPYDSKWYNKLAIISVINGDMIGVDLGNADGCVVYLSHEGDENLHGMILGRNFTEFMEYWSILGCVGPEGWEIEPFVEGDQGINPFGVNASVWRKWFGLE